MTDVIGSDDDDGGMPTWAIVLIVVVAGIPLLLMMTVVLAAVIGAFVLGLGGGGGAMAPVADWNATADPGEETVTFRHDGGDAIERQHLAVTVDGEPTSDWEAPEDSVTAGDPIVVRGVDPGATVTLYWDTGEDREIQATHRQPNA